MVEHGYTQDVMSVLPYTQVREIKLKLERYASSIRFDDILKYFDFTAYILSVKANYI